MVVWVSNLTSQVGTGKFTNQIIYMINLPYYQYSIIIGLLLSDGWMSIPVLNKNISKLGFYQSLFY